MPRLLAALMFCFSVSALAQGLEPGEWQFNTTMTSPMMPQPQASTFTRCIRKEEAEKPEKWMGGDGKTEADCKVNTTKKGDGYAWELSCPKSNMRGTGVARIGRGTMESEQKMSGDMQGGGQKFEMLIKMTGKRLGACK